MKNQQPTRIAAALFGFAVFGLMALQGTGKTQPKPTGDLTAANALKIWDDKGQTKEIYTFVTLFKNGEAVRSKEIVNNGLNSNSGTARWTALPLGSYEVHFETQGYGTVIKRAVVTQEATADVVLTAVTKNDEVWGGGPTLHDLQKRIEALEAKLAQK